jgi:hypothetical protein
MSDPIESAITGEHSRQERALEAALAQIDRAFGKNATGEVPPLPGTMTERVARVLFRREFPPVDDVKFEDLSEPERDDYFQTARDIFAAMGQPTEEMLDDAEGWQPKDSYHDLETERERIEFLWGVMLDCAEAELSKETLARKAKAEEWDRLSPEEQAASWAKWDEEHKPPRF